MNASSTLNLLVMDTGFIQFIGLTLAMIGILVVEKGGGYLLLGGTAIWIWASFRIDKEIGEAPKGQERTVFEIDQKLAEAAAGKSERKAPKREALTNKRTVAAGVAKEEQKVERQDKRQKLDYWLKLEGHKFEAEFADLLRESGWKVQVTPPSNDGGIDIEGLTPDGKRAAIQCKRWKGRVRAPEVRDLRGAASVDEYELMVVIGTGGFTETAIKFAKASGVDLWDSNDLERLINSAANGSTVVSQQIDQARVEELLGVSAAEARRILGEIKIVESVKDDLQIKPDVIDPSGAGEIEKPTITKRRR